VDGHLVNKLEYIELINFRNHRSFVADLTGGFTVITGPNGVGKTNILEAISLLSPGRGLKSTHFKEMVNFADQTSWHVTYNIHSGNMGYHVAMHCSLGDSATRRDVLVDGQHVHNIAELANIASLVWFYPQMDQMAITSSSNRRHFFDRIVYSFIAEHAKQLTSYQKLTKERLKLLENNCRDQEWLSMIEKQIADAGCHIAANRNIVCQILQSEINKAESPFPKVGITLTGEVEKAFRNGETHENIKEIFVGYLAQNRKIDAAHHRTYYGPHRCDLNLVYQEKGTCLSICSTGERKAMLISIILAQTKALLKDRGILPILLLDEVFVHLDHCKREFLIGELSHLGAQTFITGIDINQFSNMLAEAKYISLEREETTI
jgi:DNA replication and repair protein RecF